MATSEELALPDQDWTFGLTSAARDGYARVAGSWTAMFQVAWIDAAFEPLTSDRIDALDRPDLSAAARQRLTMLRTPVPTLPGGIDAWSIDRMRARPEATSASWWEKQAAATAAARQYGLAMACYREAELLDPARYYDPPRQMQGLPLQVEQHLAAVRG